MTHQKDGGQVGKTILHYKILEKLGEGGMGVVYKAVDTKLNREVAIKFLPHHIAPGEEERERFKIEAQAAAALNHPNIATIYAVEEVDGETFIVMEYIRGRELKDIINSNLPKMLDMRKVLDYATQIADGLQAAHEEGVIHRDIKSANIMITEKGQVKIMDFGLAKVIGGAELTKKHSTLGTAAYMSPEQACGDDIDHRTDIWSFGVVLYEMLMGQMPFCGEYDSAIIYSVLNEKPESITEKRTDVPFEIEQITYKCLQKNREHRHQTFDEVLNDLKMTTIAVDSGKSKPQAKQIPKKTKKEKTVFVALAAALLIILSVFIATFLFQQKIAEPAVTKVKPLTTTALISEVDPDISPDGSKVIYSSVENENWDVWVHQIASGQRLNITHDYGGTDGHARWSPDGNWISFNSSRDGGGIYLVSEMGGNIRQIVSHHHDTRDVTGVNWSLDGKKLVYTVSDTLKTVTVKDGIRSTIPLPHNCRDPAWSPDGSRIVYVTNNWYGINSQIRTVNVDGSDPVIVIEGSGWLFTPLWSPDGKRIFFKWNQDGIRDLWRIPVDKKGNPRGSIKQVTTGWNLFDFSLSTDGSKLAYCKEIPLDNIWSLPLKTDQTLKMEDAIQVTAKNQHVHYLAISPDYEWFAFISAGKAFSDLSIIRKDGKELRQLTADSLEEAGPSWSPDSKRIAYHAAVPNRNNDIYTVSIVGGTVSPIINHPANDSYPSWSPKGDTIIFQSDRSGNEDIWMVSLHNNTVRQLTNHEAYDGNASFSSDGDSIAFVSNRSGAFEIYITSISTGSIRKLTNIKANEILYPIWSPDNQTIYIEYNPEGGDRYRQIWQVAVKDGITRKIIDSKETLIHPQCPLTLACDSERLYFVRRRSVSDIWIAQLEYK